MMNGNDPANSYPPEVNAHDSERPMERKVESSSQPTVELTSDFDADKQDQTEIVASSVSSPAADPHPQRLGKYTIKCEIGRGGMGVVYEAFDPDLRRTVALKTLGPHLARSDVARRRFKREAWAAAAINHPNVLTIHSVEQDHDVPFLVMEFVAGHSLKEYLSARGKLDPIEAIRLSCQIADGLAAAHAQGVIHRDVKPGNIMLHEGATRARIADFGLARVAYDNADQSSHEIAGTPAYMAPEQIRGAQIDARSDLFCFGGVIYHMLSGHVPFRGKSQAETIHKILDTQPRRLQDLTIAVPPVLSDIVEKLLQKNPDDRFQSASQVAEILRQLLIQLNQSASHEMMDVLTRHPEITPRLVNVNAKATVPPARPASFPITIGVVTLALIALGMGIFAVINQDKSKSIGPSLPVDADAIADPVDQSRDRTMTSLTVGPDSHYKSIAAALKVAAPNCTITVLGPGPFTEAVRVDNPALNGLTLRANPRATLQCANDADSFKLENVTGVTIEGFDFDFAGVVRHGFHVDGHVEKLAIQDCTFTHGTEKVTHSLMAVGCHSNRPDSVIQIKKCRFDSPGSAMCLTVDAGEFLMPSVVCEECQFSGRYTHFYATHSCRHLGLAGNVFLGGTNAINLNLMTWSPDSRVEIVNNTFLGTKHWLGFVNSFRGVSPPLDLTDSRVCNNLILGGENVQGGADQFATALKTWTFAANWHEVGKSTNIDPAEAARLVILQDSLEIPVRSDYADPAFLVPQPASPLLTSGCGGDLPRYIGAKGPLNVR